MKVIIVGAGKVGYSMAQMLSAENHDVTIIEQSPQRLQVLDDYTVKMTLEAPSPSFLQLSQGTMLLLPEHILGGMTLAEIIASPFNLAPVGSGPYQVDHLIINEGVIQGVVLISAVLFVLVNLIVDLLYSILDPRISYS